MAAVKPGAEIPAPKSGPARAADRDGALDAALDRRGRFDLKEVTLDALADRLRAEFGVDVLIDRQALADEGIDPTDTFTADLSAATLAEALDLALGPKRVGWTTRGGAVLLGSPTVIDEMTEVRVYDVTDLVPKDETAGATATELIQLLSLVPGTTWLDVDGVGGQMQPFKVRDKQLLVVTQTGVGHHRIRRLLRAIREAAEASPDP